MVNQVDPEALRRARERIRAQQAAPIPGFASEPSPTQPTGFSTQPEEEGPGAIQGFISRVTSPLVDVPTLPGGAVGRFVERGIEELTSPLGIVSAALIPVTGGASLGLRGALGVGARLATRGAAEIATGAAASTAASEVAERLPEDTPAALRAALTLGAGAIAGVGTAAGTSRALRSQADTAAREVAQMAEAAAKSRTPEAGIMAEAIARARTVPRSEQKALATAQRTAQASRARTARGEVLQGGGLPSQAEQAARGAAKGEFSRVQFEAPQVDMQVVETMRGQIDEFFDPRALEFSKFTANDGLDKILAGAVPPPSELKVLEQVFGGGLVEAVRLHRGFGAKVADALNFPRALVATADWSAPMRQGIMLAGRHPIEFAQSWRPMVRAFFDKDYYQSAVDELRGLNGPESAVRAARADAANLAQTAGKITGREEPFIGMALFGGRKLGAATTKEKIFGKGSATGMTGLMAASERAYSLYLDTLRRSVFEKFVRNLDKAGISNRQTEQLYAAFLNRATGRGAEKILEGNLGKVLNASFFAPNYTMSRFLAPTSLFTADPVVRKQVAQDLGGFIGSGMAALGTLAIAAQAGLIPGLSIEMDPRSSDFGKIRIGQQRLEFWGGYQPIARSIVQAALGQKKSPSSGRVSEADRLAVVGRFLQSKASPAAGLGIDVLRGETFLGDRIDFTPDSALDQASQRLVPLVFQDIIEGYETVGWRQAVLGGTAAFVGGGVTTFESLAEIKNDVALRAFGVADYRDLTGSQQRLVDQHERVRAKEEEYQVRAGNDYSMELDRIEQTRLQSEQAFAARLVSGQFQTRKGFADAIEEAQLRASVERDAARRNFTIPDAEPDSPLQLALDSFYGLYEQADLGAASGVKTGQVDWDVFETLERELMERLTPEQREFVEARRRSEHDPLVAWYFNNKDYVSASDYYTVRDAEFARFSSAADSLGAQSYGDLLSLRLQAQISGDRAAEGRLDALVKRIDRLVSKRRETMRIRDPKLDRALFEIGRVTTLKTAAARQIAGGVHPTE